MSSARPPPRDLTRPVRPASSRSSARPTTRSSGATGCARGALRGDRPPRRPPRQPPRRRVLGRPALPLARRAPRAPPSSSSLAVPPARLRAGGRRRARRRRPRDRRDHRRIRRLGAAGAPAGRALVERVRAAGAVLLGPNCLGRLRRRRRARARRRTPSRPARSALISQSGNLALELGLLAGEAGLGFSRFVSLGNQADLEAADLIRDLAAHAATELIAVYVEDFRDGRAFVAAARGRRGRQAGRPARRRAAPRRPRAPSRSHTGALASDGAVDRRRLPRRGHRARRARRSELIDLAEGLLRAPPAAGAGASRRSPTAAATAGSPPALADARRPRGARLSAGDRRALRRACRRPPAAANPVDLAGGGEQDIRTFDHAARALLDSGEVDALLLTGYFGGYSEYGEALAARGDLRSPRRSATVARARRAGRSSSTRCTADNAAAAALRRRAASRSTARSSAPSRPSPRLAARARAAPAGVAGAARAPSRPVTGDGLLRPPARCSPPAASPFARRADGRATPTRRGRGRSIGYPVVLKALGLLHKSDAGGVVLGLGDEAALTRRVRPTCSARLAPPAFSVERMAPVADGRRAARRRAPRRRASARSSLVGLGGVYAEVLDDVAVALAPGRRRRTGRAPAPLAARRAAPARRPRPPAGRRPRRRRGRRGAVAASPPRTRRSPRSRSTRCSRRPTARSASTRASCSPRRWRRRERPRAARRRPVRRAGLRPRPAARGEAQRAVHRARGRARTRRIARPRCATPARVVITGGAARFSAGADVTEMRDLDPAAIARLLPRDRRRLRARRRAPGPDDRGDRRAGASAAGSSSRSPATSASRTPARPSGCPRSASASCRAAAAPTASSASSARRRRRSSSCSATASTPTRRRRAGLVTRDVAPAGEALDHALAIASGSRRAAAARGRRRQAGDRRDGRVLARRRPARRAPRLRPARPDGGRPRGGAAFTEKRPPRFRGR